MGEHVAVGVPSSGRVVTISGYRRKLKAKSREAAA